MCDWRLAVICLMLSPPGELQPIPTASPDLWMSLQTVAYDLEMADIGERWSCDFHSDLQFCQINLDRMRDAPSVRDTYRMPTFDFAKGAVIANQAYCEYLRNLVEVYPHRGQDITDHLSVLGRHQWIWVNLMNAVSSQNGWVARRLALIELRCTLGGDYYSGCWPPWIPQQLLQPID